MTDQIPQNKANAGRSNRQHATCSLSFHQIRLHSYGIRLPCPAPFQRSSAGRLAEHGRNVGRCLISYIEAASGAPFAFGKRGEPTAEGDMF